MGTTRTRMNPDSRREQLLELGVRLLATRSLDELSIDMLAEEAGISRGLLYHYFANRKDFQRAVVRRAADELVRVTAPPVEGEPLERLAASLDAYVGYVEANLAGYTSLLRAAASGDAELEQIYTESRATLTDRIFEAHRPGARLLDVLGAQDGARSRMMVAGWSAMTEQVVLAWVRDPRGVSRSELLAMLAGSLPGVLAAV